MLKTCCGKCLVDAKEAAPRHASRTASDALRILIGVPHGLIIRIPASKRSLIPGKRQLPPVIRIELVKFLLSSKLWLLDRNLWIDTPAISSNPACSIPIRLGWKRISGHLNLSTPISIWKSSFAKGRKCGGSVPDEPASDFGINDGSISC